jgi:hypothetical protein
MPVSLLPDVVVQGTEDEEQRRMMKALAQFADLASVEFHWDVSGGRYTLTNKGGMKITLCPALPSASGFIAVDYGQGGFTGGHACPTYQEVVDHVDGR